MTGCEEATAPRILLVEDDVTLAGALVRRLRREGYRVELGTDGEQGGRLARELQPDLVLLDLMLPRCSGLEVLRGVTMAGLRAIVLTACVDLNDRLRCFELGAVDYVPKPFFMDEICARIRARLHQDPHAAHRLVHVADIQVDLDARCVTRQGALVPLTRREFTLLAYLVQRPGRAVSRSQLAEASAVLGEPALARTVDSHVARLRRKLGSAGGVIATVWGVGYRFEPDVP